MYLLQSRAKLERADIHIGEIKGRLLALEETDTAFVDIHPEHGTERLTHTLDESSFEKLALAIGDAVHNLNCALDYAWLQTIELLAPVLVSKYAKFPVYQAAKELEGQLRERDVNTLCPALFALLIDDVKPCDGGNTAIWPIHCFANRDKHRLLIPTLAEGHISGIQVQDKAGGLWPGSGSSALQRPPYCIDFAKGLHVTKKGKLTANVVVEDGKFGCRMDIPNTLVFHAAEILCVMEAFEGLLESQGF